MNQERRLIGLRLIVGIQGALLVAIGFFDADRIIGFASGFGLVMFFLALTEPALARMRERLEGVDSRSVTAERSGSDR